MDASTLKVPVHGTFKSIKRVNRMLGWSDPASSATNTSFTVNTSRTRERMRHTDEVPEITGYVDYDSKMMTIELHY
ncbi:unnamed protein product [Darwinula stevensoni]|uniref:Uncharacterized protein n=1 Tax=Darwinula stevensoni TaxID=69355 RepID=A0A7R8X2N6_9CRUS|nr:unnamed protein product [Darwinula stevensoni]CAG0883535.1 unnamed protein product [Darwinula stevensoni]